MDFSSITLLSHLTNDIYSIEYDNYIIDNKIGNIIDKTKENIIHDDKNLLNSFSRLLFLLKTDYTFQKQIINQLQITNMRDFSKAFLSLFNISYNYYDSFLLLNIFNKLFDEEFKLKKLNTVLRSNTFIISCISTFGSKSKLTSQYIINYVLPAATKAMNCTNICLEVNPIRINTDSDAELSDILSYRVELISNTLSNFLTDIIQSFDKIPYEIRIICKQIKDSILKYNPDSDNTTIAVNIGAFFWLRYIYSVQYYIYKNNNIIKTRDNTRNLIIASKILQNLCNGCRYKNKEEYMIPFNEFLGDNQERIHSFFLNLADIEYTSKYQIIDLLGDKCETNIISLTINEFQILKDILINSNIYINNKYSNNIKDDIRNISLIHFSNTLTKEKKEKHKIFIKLHSLYNKDFLLSKLEDKYEDLQYLIQIIISQIPNYNLSNSLTNFIKDINTFDNIPIDIIKTLKEIYNNNKHKIDKKIKLKQIIKQKNKENKEENEEIIKIINKMKEYKIQIEGQNIEYKIYYKNITK